MDIKKKILKRLVDTDDQIVMLISHHWLMYVKLMIISVIGIIIVFFLYKFLLVFSEKLAQYVAGLLATFLYIYFLMEFFDIYLDAVVITTRSIIIYKWYGLFKTTTDVIDFEAIESVYSDQSGILDVLFNKGDLYFRRAGHENVFEDVPNPTKVANDVNSIINNYLKPQDEETEEENKGDDKIKLLAEVLAEVVREIR